MREVPTEANSQVRPGPLFPLFPLTALLAGTLVAWACQGPASPSQDPQPQLAEPSPAPEPAPEEPDLEPTREEPAPRSTEPARSEEPARSREIAPKPAPDYTALAPKTKKARQRTSGQYELLPQLFDGIGVIRYGLALDHAGKRFLVEEYGQLNYWEIESGRRAGTLPAGNATIDDLHLATGTGGKIAGAFKQSDGYGNETYRILLWNTRQDRLVREVEVKMNFIGHSWNLALSPDGSHVAFGGEKRIVLHNLNTGRHRDVKVWDSADCKYQVEFADNKGLLVRGLEGFEKTPLGTAMIDVSSGTVRWREAGLVAVSKDAGGRLFAVQANGAIELRRQIQGSSHLKINSVDPVRFTPDGKLLLANSIEHGAALWNTQTGERHCRLENTSRVDHEIQFTPDSKRIVWDRKVLGIWEVDTGRLLREIRNPFQFLSRGLFTPDGNQMALIGSPSVAVDLASLSQLPPQDGERFTYVGPEGDPYTRQHLHRDGEPLVPLRYLLEDEYITGGTYTLFLKDAATGDLIHTFENQPYGTYGTAWAVHPTQPLFVMVGSGKRVVRFLEMETWKEVGSFEMHEPTRTLDIHPTLPLLVTRSEQGYMFLYNLDNGESIKMLVGSDGEWIAYAEDGLFGGSKHAGRLVSVYDGDHSYGIDQFGIHWNRPDVLLERIGLGDATLRRHYSNRAERRFSRAGISAADTKGELSPPTARITSFRREGKFASLDYQLSASHTSLSSVQVYVNDVPLFGPEGKQVSGEQSTGKERIELVSGNNKVEVSCRDARGQESLRSLEQIVYPEEVTGDLYFLGFGASRYANSDLDLQYAHKDALDLEALFKGLDQKKTAGGFRTVHTRVLTNEQVTREAIEASADFLAPAKVDDTVVLFIAGHGVHADDKVSSYFYLTHETALEDIEGTAAPFSTIEALLHGIAPRRKLFLMDTCESGEIDPEQEQRLAQHAGTRGLVPRTAQRGITVVGKDSGSSAQGPRTWLRHRDRFIYNDLLRRSGAIVFSSSQGGEYSYESDDIENGYFTEALLAAFGQGAADENNDAWVTSVELQTFVSSNVSRQTGSAQNPTVDRDNLDIILRFPRAGAQSKPTWWDEPLEVRPAAEAGPGDSSDDPIPVATQSLQELIDSTPDGGTLYLERARYESKLPIRINQRRDLTIVGVPGTTIVNTTNFELILAIQDSFGIRIQNCIAYHETIKSCAAGVFDVYKCQYIRIENCELNGCGTVGLYALSTEHVDVVNCHIHSNQHTGFQFGSQLNHLRLFGNRIHDNGEVFRGALPDNIESRGNIARGSAWNPGN